MPGMTARYEALIKHLDQRQISEQARVILDAVAAGEPLSEAQKEELFNRQETAALLSIRTGRQVKAEYVKEIARPQLKPGRTHVVPARLRVEKVAGRSHLYTVGQIMTVPMEREPRRWGRAPGKPRP